MLKPGESLSHPDAQLFWVLGKDHPPINLLAIRDTTHMDNAEAPMVAVRLKRITRSKYEAGVGSMGTCSFEGANFVT
jgi:hypothetical protein